MTLGSFAVQQVSAAAVLADEVMRLLNKIAQTLFLNNFEFWRFWESRFVLTLPLLLHERCGRGGVLLQRGLGGRLRKLELVHRVREEGAAK